MRFRPCIDLHQGAVKQIVGATLSDGDGAALETNFMADRPSRWYAGLYRKDNLTGGHIIMLGPGNEGGAKEALAAWPGGMQVGGGIHIDNAGFWLDAGAGAVIVTSWVFHDGKVDVDRLKRLAGKIGKNRLVLDLSCRRQGADYKIVTNRWQTFTDENISPGLLSGLSASCCEFLVHGVDVEGRCRGIESDLVDLLGQWSEIPTTYAGGIHSKEDIQSIERLGRGHIDFTVGSALDIFGGSGLVYGELVDQYGSLSDINI